MSGKTSNSELADWNALLKSGSLSQAGSQFENWLADQITQAKTNQLHECESSFENNGSTFHVSFGTLSGSGGLCGYALRVHRYEVDSGEDESSLVTRQQWHDIKNRLGGLKLYATFLQKKLVGKEDEAVADKLLNGINGLITHLAQVRRGEPR